jgi:hypothetical protein
VSIPDSAVRCGYVAYAGYILHFVYSYTYIIIIYLITSYAPSFLHALNCSSKKCYDV